MSAPLSADLAQIGKSVVIKGELSGSEDLYVDGQVEGSIALKNQQFDRRSQRPGQGLGGGQGNCGARANLRATCRPATASNCANPPWLPAIFPRSGFRSRKAPT